MNPVFLFMSVSLVHGVLMMADEFYFHHRRFVPVWERIGHPLDTLTVLFCFGILGFAPQTYFFELLFWVGVAVSCVFVVKDEIVHFRHCQAGEMILHGLLFVLHPVLLYSAYLCWSANQGILKLFCGVLFLFMSYQIIYWNFFNKFVPVKGAMDNETRRN